MDFGIANHGERTGREKAAQVATSLCPRQFPMILHAADSYAAGNNFGSLKRSPRTIMAQAALTGRTHGCTDQPANVKKTLANSEPSTHGTSRRSGGSREQAIEG
jgi:hypothetical protein